MKKGKRMKTELLEKLHKKIIVSCQALPHEPLYRKEGGVMVLMAKAAQQAGAAGIRAQGLTDVVQIKEQIDLPLIGIIKINYEGYASYITPTMKEIDALVEAKADIIALDATLQARGDGKTAPEFIREIKAKYPDVLLMADISTLEEGIEAEKAGVDFVGTTMNGYTPYTQDYKHFDTVLIENLVKHLNIPVIAEGKIHTPAQAKAALDAGAFCVVVGGAITRPMEIAERFIEGIK